MSELRENIIRSLKVPRDKAIQLGYKNAKGAVEGVSSAFIGAALNEGVKFFDRTTLNRGKNEISQGGETCEIRFTTGPNGEQVLGEAAIQFFAKRIIDYSNYNSIVDTLGDFYQVYNTAAAADPNIDFGAVIGDAVMNPGDTPGSLKLDVLYFKNQTMASLRERGAGFEDALHYLFGNTSVSETEPKPSGKRPDEPRTDTERDMDELYYSPIEVFIRDLTKATIASWGSDDARVKASIEVAVRRAVRDGLERGNERANAINNINIACDNIIGLQGGIFIGLTRENYQEKMNRYIDAVKSRPEHIAYYTKHFEPFPSQPVPTNFLRSYLNDYFSKPENASKRPPNLDTMTSDQLQSWVTSNSIELPAEIMPRPEFMSLDHACTQSTMFGKHLSLASSEITELQSTIRNAQAEITKQNNYWSYWTTKYSGETFNVGGIELSSRPVLKTELIAGSDDAVRNCIKNRQAAIARAIESGKYKGSALRALITERDALKYDMNIINGKVSGVPTRFIGKGKYPTRRPSEIFKTISEQNTIIADCQRDITAWNEYRTKLGAIAPQNDAMLIMACCSVLYDLNLNKMGGEIITANQVLDMLGEDAAAKGVKFDPEYQKQALSILNNLFYLNEEQRINDPDSGTLYQTTQTVRNFVYNIYDKYAPPILDPETKKPMLDEHGNKMYPPGKLPLDDLQEHMTALGLDQNSPFFGRGKEMMEQMTMALASVKEAHAINNFNPVKASFAKMDPKLKDLSYRKMVMDYYKKEGLLPAKAVKIKQITYVLGKEYVPQEIIDRPPTVDPPPPPEENHDKLDYCREIAEMLHHKRSHLTGARTQSGEKIFGDDVTEDQYYAGQRMAYASAESWFKNLIGKNDEFVRVQALLKDGLAKGKTIEQIMAEVKGENAKDPVLRHLKSLKDPQTLRFVVGLCPDLIGDLDKTSLGRYYSQIQIYNSEIDKLIKGEPTSIPLSQLMLLHDSLKVGADYKAGRSNTIFPALMNHGIKLVFSQLNESQISGGVGTGDTRHAVFTYKVPDPNNPGAYKEVPVGEYLARYRVLAMEKAKELEALTSTKTYAKFKDFLTIRVDKGEITITNDLVHGGSRRGVRVNPFDKPEAQKESIGSKIVSPTSLKPGQTVYVLDPKQGLIEVPSDQYQGMANAPVDLVQVAEGKFVSISHIGAINDLAISSMIELKKRREAEAAAEAGGGGPKSGLAEPVEIKPQHQGELPEHDPVVDEDIPETPIIGDDGGMDDN